MLRAIVWRICGCVTCEQKPEFLDYNFGLGMKGAAWETSVRSFNKATSLQLALLNKVGN